MFKRSVHQTSQHTTAACETEVRVGKWRDAPKSHGTDRGCEVDETYGGEKEHHAAEREPTGVAQVTCGGDTVVNQTVTSSVTRLNTCSLNTVIMKTASHHKPCTLNTQDQRVEINVTFLTQHDNWSVHHVHWFMYTGPCTLVHVPCTLVHVPCSGQSDRQTPGEPAELLTQLLHQSQGQDDTGRDHDDQVVPVQVPQTVGGKRLEWNWDIVGRH